MEFRRRGSYSDCTGVTSGTSMQQPVHAKSGWHSAVDLSPCKMPVRLPATSKTSARYKGTTQESMQRCGNRCVVACGGGRVYCLLLGEDIMSKNRQHLSLACNLPGEGYNTGGYVARGILQEQRAEFSRKIMRNSRLTSGLEVM